MGREWETGREGGEGEKATTTTWSMPLRNSCMGNEPWGSRPLACGSVASMRTYLNTPDGEICTAGNSSSEATTSPPSCTPAGTGEEGVRKWKAPATPKRSPTTGSKKVASQPPETETPARTFLHCRFQRLSVGLLGGIRCVVVPGSDRLHGGLDFLTAAQGHCHGEEGRRTYTPGSNNTRRSQTQAERSGPEQKDQDSGLHIQVQL